MRNFEIKFNKIFKKIICFFFVSQIIACVSKPYYEIFPEKKKLSGEESFNYSAGKFGIENNDTLVDIGCGNGYIETVLFQHYDNLFFYLEDIKKEKIKKDKKINVKTGKKAHFDDYYKFYLGTTTTIPLKSNSYKKVLCSNTLHEMKYQKEMLSEIYRILRKDGLLIITETYPYSKKYTKLSCGNLFLQKDSIINILTNNNFNLLKCDTTTFPYRNSKSINHHILTFAKK